MADRKEPPFYNDHSMGAFHQKLPFYETMELFIETLTGTCFELRVSPFEAVLSVKAKIQRLEGIPVAQQHLIWNNLELDDEYCLHDYGIAEGCTLKLVLAMRGGPINTRRVTLDGPTKEVADLMEGAKEEGWERSLTNKQVTFLVYREGDQLNFFRVVDRGDGTLTPLSESVSSSVYNVYAGEEEDGEGSAATKQNVENSITMNKMKLLKAKMEDMNINKKKSTKLKPRPPVGLLPCSSSFGLPGTRHHHRLFRTLPPINQPRHSNTQLPPIRDQDPAGPFITRRAPSSFSSSCYMLQEEEPWEAFPPLAKIRPPPKVSRLDVGGTRLMRDCVYPQLPPLPTRPNPEGMFEMAESGGEALRGGLLEESGGLVEPTQTGTLFSDLLSETLSLDVSGSVQEGLQSLEVGAPSTPSLLSTWALGTNDWTNLSSSLQISPPLALPPTTPPIPVSTKLSQPFEFTGSSSLQPTALVEPGNTSPRPSSAMSDSPPRPARLHAIKVDSPGKRTEIISKYEARDITQMANQASKEPIGSLSNSRLLASLATRAAGGLGRDSGLPPAVPVLGASRQIGSGSKPLSIATTNMQLLQDDIVRQMSPVHRVVSYTVSNSHGSAGGASTSIRRLGTQTYHLPPIKVPTGSKKSFKHCFLCGKKTGLATSYECRCGNNFCATHRYAETHDCSYDYKSAGRRFLQETNPIVSAPKLPKI